MGALPIYKKSFFCSPYRTDGLGLAMTYEHGLVQCNVLVDNRFEGYEDVIHGGIVTGILDTMVWYSILLDGRKICMTRNIEMDFFRPVFCNRPYRAKSRYLGVDGKDVHAEGWIEDENGEICTRFTGLFREAKDLPFSAIVNRFDFSRSAPEIKDYLLSLIDEQEESAGKHL
jgi:uncharacterized protein (TIGR00369 family)